jgi:hypothetical protein
MSQCMYMAMMSVSSVYAISRVTNSLLFSFLHAMTNLPSRGGDEVVNGALMVISEVVASGLMIDA